MHLQMFSVKCQPFCLSLNMLITMLESCCHVGELVIFLQLVLHLNLLFVMEHVWYVYLYSNSIANLQKVIAKTVVTWCLPINRSQMLHIDIYLLYCRYLKHLNW